MSVVFPRNADLIAGFFLFILQNHNWSAVNCLLAFLPELPASVSFPDSDCSPLGHTVPGLFSEGATGVACLATGRLLQPVFPLWPGCGEAGKSSGEQLTAPWHTTRYRAGNTVFVKNASFLNYDFLLQAAATV